jgi:hypothetical protein
MKPMEPMKPMKPMKPMEPMSGGEQWWPNDLGEPSSTGSQNSMRYAFFSEARRLLIEKDNKLTTYEPLAKLPQPDEPVALLAFAERACRWIFWPDAANSAIWTTSERICGVDRLHPLCAARGGRV